MKYTLDTAIAVLILMVAVAFLVQRKLGYIAVWLVVITAVIGYGVKMSLTAAVTISVATVVAVILVSGQTLKERYENPSKGEKEGKEKDTDEKEPEPHSKSKTEQISDNNLNAHLDAGTTILHAFQKLNPQQVLQMRDDTKELMETQKQLVETLSSLGPQVQQGAELVKSFQGMFGGNISEGLKK
jgi:hypothetical protein